MNYRAPTSRGIEMSPIRESIIERVNSPLFTTRSTFRARTLRIYFNLSTLDDLFISRDKRAILIFHPQAIIVLSA